MKKTTIALLLALLVVATIVPAVIAQNGGEQGNNGGPGDGLNAPPPRDVPKGAPFGARLDAKNDRRQGMGDALETRKQELAQNRADFRNKFGNFTNMTTDDRKAFLQTFKDRREQIRGEFKQDLAKVKEQFQQDLEKVKELRGKFQDERKGFMDARDQLRAQCGNGTAVNGTNATVCKEARKKMNDESKTFMGDSAEQMLKIISTTKTRIQTDANIDNATASAVVAQLDARAAAITDAKAKIDALTNTSTVNETKTAAEALRVAWQDARVTIRLAEGLLTHARFQEFINHLNAMDVRFKEARDTLATGGKDVTNLTAAITAFEKKISDVTASYQQAKDSYLSAMSTVKTEADANALLKSTQVQLKTVRDDATASKDLVRNVVKALGALDKTAVQDVAKKIGDDTKSSEPEVSA